MIVDAFAEIASSKDFGVSFDGNGIGEGMRQEAAKMKLCGRPIVSIAELNEAAGSQIAQVIASLNEV